MPDLTSPSPSGRTIPVPAARKAMSGGSKRERTSANPQSRQTPGRQQAGAHTDGGILWIVEGIRIVNFATQSRNNPEYKRRLGAWEPSRLLPARRLYPQSRTAVAVLVLRFLKGRTPNFGLLTLWNGRRNTQPQHHHQHHHLIIITIIITTTQPPHPNLITRLSSPHNSHTTPERQPQRCNGRYNQ